MRGEIEAAKLQELAMVSEAPPVTGFGKNGHRIDGTDAWHLAQAIIVGVLAEKCLGLEDVPLSDQASLSNHHAEHRNGRTAGRQRQADGRPRGLVDLGQKPSF